MIMVANLGLFQVASVNYNITWICMILNFKVRTKRSSTLRRLYCPTGGTKSLPLYDSEIAQGHSKIMSEFDKFCQCKHGATCWKQHSGLWPRYDCSSFMSNLLENDYHVKSACYIHDMCYQSGRSKSLCDNEFRHNFKQLCYETPKVYAVAAGVAVSIMKPIEKWSEL